MWYFAWLLGLPLAAIFAVMNAMWLEMQRDRALIAETEEDQSAPMADR
jgi:cyd operon protein YbgT